MVVSDPKMSEAESRVVLVVSSVPRSDISSIMGGVEAPEQSRMRHKAANMIRERDSQHIDGCTLVVKAEFTQSTSFFPMIWNEEWTKR